MVVVSAGRVRSTVNDEALATTSRIALECVRVLRHRVEKDDAAADLVLQVWRATASVILKELEAGKCVSVQSFGLFTLREVEDAEHGSPDADSCIQLLDPAQEPHFTLAEDFKQQYGLESDDEEEEELVHSGPYMRLSAASVAHIAEVSKDTVQSALNAMIGCVGEAMAQTSHLVVSLAPLGNLWCSDGVVSFDVPKPEPPLAAGTSPTVRSTLLQLQRYHGLDAAAEVLDSFAPWPSPSERSGLSRSSLASVPSAPSGKFSSPLQRERLKGKRHKETEASRIMTGTFHRELHPHGARFPPLLSESSRTLAVPFGGAQEPGSPSGRIAAGYGGAAAWLAASLPGVPLRSLRWWPGREQEEAPPPQLLKPSLDYERIFAGSLVVDGSPVDQEIREAGLSRDAFYECLYRYNYYVAEGVPLEAIAPFNSSWMANIQGLLDARKFNQELTASHVEVMVSGMHEEIFDDYYKALRSAIVDYTLGDERARRRVGVPFLPSPPVPWGAAPFVGVEGTHGGPPEEWREALADNRTRIAGALETCSRSSLRLLDLWHQEFDELLLVELPPPVGSRLVELDAFCRAQSAHCGAARKRFEASWLQKAAQILREEPAEGASHNKQAFYAAISTLLSTQVRSTVERSIDAYVSFFRRFAKASPMSPKQVISLSDNDDREDAFLMVRLTAQGDEVRFTTPLDQVAERLLGIFRAFVACLRGLERPDATLSWSAREAMERTHLWEVSLEEQHVRDAESFVAGVVGLNVANVEKALLLYDDYKHLLHEEDRVRRLVEDLALTREDFMAQVDELRATEAAIRERCPSEIRLQMVSIDCAEINETLCQKAGEAVKILLQAVLRNLLLKNDQLIKSFETVVNHMVKKPTSEVELVDLESHVEEFRSVGLRSLLGEFAGIRAWLRFLFECEDRLSWAMLSDRHFQAIYDSAHWVFSIDQIVSEREVNLRREREALECKFKEQRSKFLEDLDGYSYAVDRFRDCGNLRQVDDYLERIQVLRSHFTRAHAEAEKLTSKEERLGWEMSTFDQLKKGEQALNPHYELWTLAYGLDKAMKQWLRGPLFQLDPGKVEAEVNNMNQEAQHLKELFKELDQPTTASVAGQLESQLSVMITSHIGLVQALCNKCLRQRHWDQISATVGFTIEPDNVFTLNRLNDMEVGKHMAWLQGISEAATKEHAIEKLLDTMEAEWQPVGLELQPFRETGACVVAGSSIEEMQALLEDHLVKTRAMRESPYVTPLVSRVVEWEDWLNSAVRIMERWTRLQALWTELEPVFSGHDLLRQMPTECQLFRRADAVWRRVVQLAEGRRAARDLTCEPGLLDALLECCNTLEEVEEGLQDYLESKGLTVHEGETPTNSDGNSPGETEIDSA